jgi:hypothetical protein
MRGGGGLQRGEGVADARGTMAGAGLERAAREVEAKLHGGVDPFGCHPAFGQKPGGFVGKGGLDPQGDGFGIRWRQAGASGWTKPRPVLRPKVAPRDLIARAAKT